MRNRSLRVRYDDAPFPLRDDFADSHSRFWERLAAPGSWWTSAQRIDIARQTRAAFRCPLCHVRRRALSPNTVDGAHATLDTRLPDAAVEAVHRIATDASRLSRRWYQGLLAQGLSEGQYVEIIGTVVSLVSIDSFALALGLPERPLPETAGSGEPSGYRPSSAAADDAWVPMVPEHNAGTPEADLWPDGKTGNVVRAMSLVPDEVRTLKDLSAAHYLAMADVRKPGYDAGRALSRSQMELLAGRTSALNACYY